MVPIIVGGTNYYIESILWEVLIDHVKKDDEEGVGSGSKKMKVEMDRMSTVSNDELYKELVQVDPEMAKMFHPNNRRKVMRSTASCDEETKQDIKSKCDTILNPAIYIVNHCLLSSHYARACHEEPNNMDSKSIVNAVREETELPLLRLSQLSIYQTPTEL
ncbi:tRNA dimethylallyltransferase, mitochondrial [Eufriesea mexicana]|uniref:tRNA dimethylallyltransferase, mitochondrial n=1 Tax=Eufriesea mexicana TaxID=516756 RepID=A0A310SE49_9HYME|nr:tRNA dimethylallyltransferase, mitochondrial [Eufriesea mexicana]